MIHIVGTGPVGLIMEKVCQDRQWPYRIFGPKVVLEKLPQKSILLSEGSLCFLNAIGVSLPVTKRFSNLKITQQGRIHHLNILAKDYGQSHLCYMVKFRDFVASLASGSQAIPHMVSKIEKQDNQLILHAHNTPETYNAQFIIACDGVNSIAKKLEKIDTQFHNQQQAYLIPITISGNTLMQRQVTYHGTPVTLGIIPGSPGMIIATSTRPLKTPFNLADLQTLVGHYYDLSCIGEQTQLHFMPTLSQTCHKNHTLLLGNAAMTISPVAAQGLNHAIHNIKAIHNLPTFNLDLLTPLAKKMQINNEGLFKTMQWITQPTPFMRGMMKPLMATQLISPIIKDLIWQFGNRYD
ncbi:MAG: FAD-dependent monooxygenase [Pseudomonadota bacterium]|nr:FAD-dependent monooxygenase [Pseudomonadota bacterium]